MKRTMLSKGIAIILSLTLCFGLVPTTAFATATVADTGIVNDGKVFGLNGYYNIISSKNYDVIPGAVEESQIVLNNANGTRRQVMHILEIDPSNPDVSILPGYYGIDKDLSIVANHSSAGVTKVAQYYEDQLGYNVVGAMNTGLSYDSNAPYSFLVYNGEVLVDDVNGINDFHGGECSTLLCVYKNDDGTCYVELRERSQGLRGDEWQAIGANFAMVVKDGELVAKSENRGNAAARSMVGVKEDGTLVLCMNDGRGANDSIGFSDWEEGEAMLALGCKWAFNCDGGGSSSFVTKRAGETELTMRSVPCDGAERPTLNSVIIVSNVAPTGILGEVNVNSDYEYFAPNTTYTFTADAIDTHGYMMEMPSDAKWQLSDSSFGTLTDGMFVSNGKTGTVDVQIISNNTVVGFKTITISNPETLKMKADSTVLPYTTAEKIRTIALPIVALVGEEKVYYDQGTFNIELSNDAAGVLEGYNFTATSDTTVENVTITLTYLPSNTPLTYNITFGQGSKIIWDFEDKDVSGFLGQADAIKWQADQGIKEPLKSIIAAGNLSTNVHSESFIATKENGGQVHNGEASLGMSFDMRYANFNSWTYANIYNVSNTDGSGVLRDVANGNKAITLGAWVYVPEGFYTVKNGGAMALRGDFVAGASAEKAVRTNFDAKYNGKTLNSLTENDIPENRWIYAEFDLSKYNYVSINNALSTDNYSPCFARMYVKPSEAQILTYYFDDFTLDYSAAVEDRNPPVISEPTYCTADTNIEINGQTINSKVASFNAKIADYVASNAEGLDYASAKIYLDGVALNNVKASGSNLSVEDVSLSNGEHKITFEVADKLGNSTQLSRTLIVDCAEAKSTIKITGHNDADGDIEAGSVYYIDLVAEDIEDIDSVTTTIELNTANTWLLDYMIPAQGFEVSYSVNELENEFATITVTKNGKCELTGENTLVSIPVRVWSWDETWVGSGTATKLTTADAFSKQGEPVLLIEAEIIKGVIEYVDDTVGSFVGNLSVATKVLGDKTNGVWHTHDAELLTIEKTANCTEYGYENRTYCDTCKSVVDWGTVHKATGHNYEIVDAQFVCQNEDCGDVYESGTGIFAMNGKLYYSVNNALQVGWQSADDGYCYGDKTTYELYVGKNTVSGIEYTFGDNGILASGSWVVNSKGIRYSFGPGFYTRTWQEIDGEKYYFGSNSYAYTGVKSIPVNRNNLLEGIFWYEFDEDGKFIKEATDLTGIDKYDNRLWYVKDGKNYYGGLMYIDGHYYYARTSGEIVVNRTYTITKTNDLLPVAGYTFDAEGKMVNPPVIEPDEPEVPEVKNGVCADENGKLWYYVDDVKTYGGLMYIDGHYYYARTSGEIVVNRTYTITKTNDLLPVAGYTFDAEGKMVNPPVVK